MKKRLFTLLLAVVMILSLGMAALEPAGTAGEAGVQPTTETPADETVTTGPEEEKEAEPEPAGTPEPGADVPADEDVPGTVTDDEEDDADADLSEDVSGGTDGTDGNVTDGDDLADDTDADADADADDGADTVEDDMAATEGVGEMSDVPAGEDDQVTPPAATNMVQLQFSAEDEHLKYVAADVMGKDTFKSDVFVDRGVKIYAAVEGGYALKATGATVEPDTGFYRGGYQLNVETGDVTRIYSVTPDGSQTVTLTAEVTAEPAPEVCHITYEGPEEAYAYDNKNLQQIEYEFVGSFFFVPLKAGYGITVNGEPSPEGMVSVGEGVEEIIVVAVKLAEAKLAVNGDASALVGSFMGDDYLQAGDTLVNGGGYILTKGDYAITCVQGGSFSYYGIQSEEPGAALYRVYYVEATADPLTVTVEKTPAAYWAKLRVINDYPQRVEVKVSSEDKAGENVYWFVVVPEEGADIYVDLNHPEGVSSIEGFEAAAEGGKLTLDERTTSIKSYALKANDGVDEVTVRVTLAQELKAETPGAPAAGMPGVADQAAVEKKLLASAGAIVDAALNGKAAGGLSADQAAAIANAAAAGETITTKLTATAVQSPADADALKSAAGKDTITQYVDIEIVVLANDVEVGHITETSQALDFSVVLSADELAKGPLFYVVRSHEGGTAVLSAVRSGSTLTFSTDKFSTFAVVATSNIAFADVDPIPDQTYTGAAITPKPTVKANGRTLTEGTDYTVTYKNNVSAGTATAVIAGKGEFTGTKEVTFRIVQPAAAVKTSPKTGDGTPLALYGVILTASLGGLALVLGRRKKTGK